MILDDQKLERMLSGISKRRGANVTSYDLHVYLQKEIEQFNVQAIRAVASLHSYSVTLMDDTIFKADREMRRFFVHMPSGEKAYHQLLAQQYTKEIRGIVEEYSRNIAHVVDIASPHPAPVMIRCQLAMPYFAVPNAISTLSEEAREVLKLATRDYWFTVLKWLRGG